MDGSILKGIRGWPAVLLASSQAVSDVVFDTVTVTGATNVAPALGVPVHFLVQLLHIEDKRFFVHPGVDPIAIVRAATANGTGTGVVQGASTITQQLYNIRQEAKGVKRGRRTAHKIPQSMWALAKETHSSKRQILSEYLDTIYWGRSYYGIDAATLGYFRTSRDRITIAQSFFLVERLASPNLLITGRVRALLSRAPIATLLAQDASVQAELIAVYDEHFGLGDEFSKIVETVTKG